MNKQSNLRDEAVPAPDRGAEVPDRPRFGDRGSEIVLIELAKLQSDGEHLKSLLSEILSDLRDVRDRAIKLEEATRTMDRTLDETRKKVDRVHNWVIGAAAVVAFIAVAGKLIIRVWPSK